MSKVYIPSVKWKVGDVIMFNPRRSFPCEEGEPIYRKIAKVRKNGYSWYYPEWEFEAITPSGSGNHYWSENSSDPFLENWIKFGN